ncbi:unnamed protein product [Fraxinus pennsylvanica]|uniref:Uncharacterized protein n=1 Tax=Fraxinus pennsylvanica TaxID=56036 RepID=A0AAD2A3V8_9LAMI|nr:unnamed protein product [Fraxinus pennsylvanica]
MVIYFNLDSVDLIIRDCDGVGEAGIIAIARGCPLLNYLDVGGLKNLGDKGIVALSEARNCVSLEACNMIYCPGISKAGVTTLITGCQKLKKLLVEEEKVSQRTKRRAACLLVESWHGDLFFRDF